jgi:hypothetical protein
VRLATKGGRVKINFAWVEYVFRCGLLDQRRREQLYILDMRCTVASTCNDCRLTIVSTGALILALPNSGRFVR